ncbi:Dps family protein [Sediminibacterium ginsengisoli]|uniref:Starvation-inducible DNA-binding protein n=1 Tax=Sediminibacterium ginsengisoli TaxID=413434 RepID=A0A1T4L1N0_9BACT|nr:DNA starvation/stationary phase protection protein [Sediminibacterium ginsengisoli]SJZ48642.1 starvation-inducible DNA-binding protein [Sediminibacterium ginsengisoli]
MKTNIGITEKNLQASALRLNQLLADEYVLYTKVRNYHWNVEGSNFMEMHKFYEDMYSGIDELIDEIAERVRMLGHYSEGRLKDFLKLTALSEEEYTNNQKKQLQNLLSDHETLVRNLRNDINTFSDKYKDLGNADFLTGLMEKHEKWAWFVRSYLK